MRYNDTVAIGVIGTLAIDAKYVYRIEPPYTNTDKVPISAVKVEDITLDIKRKVPTWGWETVRTVRVWDIPGWLWEMLTSPDALACMMSVTVKSEPASSNIDLRDLEEKERK